MLTKATIKFIKSLQEKKYRKQEQCFIVEGAKSVLETLDSPYEVRMLVASAAFLETIKLRNIETVEATESQLASIGSFQTNDAVLAVVNMRPASTVKLPIDNFSLVLDDIRDPGNLGTIVRTADWYGVHTILASPETVDFYSPKVISSTKGSFTRVNFQYADLSDALSDVNVPVMGAFLRGDNVHQARLPKAGVLAIGNESNGLSVNVARHVTHRLTIPAFGKAESLNAAIATAILLDNLRR